MTSALGISAGIALLALLAALRGRRELRRWLGRDPYARRRWPRALLLASGAGVLAWAWLFAAQQPPRFTGAGIDVVLAIDVSTSMDVTDTAPTRLRRALRLAEQLVLAAEGARLGLVIFAGEAFVALPLTLDRDVHLTYLRSLDSEVLSYKGSDLGRALRTSARVFDPGSPRPRVLVLISDGEHAGASFDDTLVELRGAGIRVTAVGFGRPEGDAVPSPSGGPLFDSRGEVVVSRRSDAVLERIALATGGSYLREYEDATHGADVLPPVGALAVESAVPGTGLLSVLVAAALLLLAGELVSSSAPPVVRARRWRWPGWRRLRPATALLALLLVGFGPRTWLEQGDEHLARGEAQDALSLYRRNVRAYGASVESRIRIGNALYRLDEHDRAASAYLDALRRVRLEAQDDRFVASFNLGNTLLARERYAEAREHFWTALLERPDSLEAKFNYEWASERIEEPEPPPLPPNAPSPNEGEGSGGASEGGPGGGSGDAQGARQLANARRSAAPELEPEEAQRWLETIEDQVQEPLRRQAAESLGAGPRRRPGGQSW